MRESQKCDNLDALMELTPCREMESPTIVDESRDAAAFAVEDGADIV